MIARRFAVACVAALGIGAATPYASTAANKCEWLAGDLHAHSTYSHDSYGGPSDDNTPPEEAYTFGHTVTSQFAVAASRGLDYLAITDHNDVRSQNDPGWGAFDLVAVPGYENSLRGHAQMLGAQRLYDNGAGEVADVQRVADELRADGGVFQINHPAEGSTEFPHDRDWSYGSAIVPDAVEVWNISRLYQPPLPSASSNDDAVAFWEGFLDDGHRVAATGGSDNHYVVTSPVQGVGQPTTWVCASRRSTDGILKGLRKGRTFISHQPPGLGGPRLFLEGDRNRDGTFETLVGDTVGPNSHLRVRVENAPGSLLHLYSTGGKPIAEPILVTGTSFSHSFAPPEGSGWVRAEVTKPDAADVRSDLCDDGAGSHTTYCRNKLLVLALTSAIYIGDE